MAELRPYGSAVALLAESASWEISWPPPCPFSATLAAKHLVPRRSTLSASEFSCDASTTVRCRRDVSLRCSASAR